MCNPGNTVEQKGAMEDLQQAILRAEEAVAATPHDHPNRAVYSNSLGSILAKRYERTGAIEDLQQATLRAEEAIAATPHDHPNRAVYSNSLGSILAKRYERTGAIEDLQQATLRAEEAIAATPHNHPNRAVYSNSLGSILAKRYERTGAMEDLQQATLRAEEAIAATPHDHPNRAVYLNSLGSILAKKYKRTGAIEDLAEAISRAEEAVIMTPRHHRNWAIWLNNLGNQLGKRFDLTGVIDDINRAIHITNMAVIATPFDHPNRAGMLGNLGNWLGRRFNWTGSIDDLNLAIQVVNMAVAATPLDHPDQAGMLGNLGNWLGRRFDRTGSIDDLNLAIQVVNMAVAATPLDHPDQADRLNSLGNWLGRRFDRTGSIGDLDEAIEVVGTAVNAIPFDHPNRASMLGNLGNWLGRRFDRTGSIGDLDEAIKVAGTAVEATPLDHPNRAGMLGNLGNWFGRRFDRTGVIYDINHAIHIINVAIEATPLDHPNRAGMLGNLGNWLGRRFDQTGSIGDLDEAIKAADTAVKATPLDHPDRAGMLNNLGNWLGRRFDRTGSIGDLDEAIKVAGTAVEATPLDHPNRANRFSTLGNWLRRRFDQTGATEYIERSLLSYREGWNCQNAPPSVRINLARDAAKLLALQSNWEESSFFLQEAVKLLPSVSPRSLENTDKQHMLGEFTGLASMAAATALNAGKGAHCALKLLELGRGIITGLMLEMRADISDLEQQHPELAKEFISLRNELNSPPGEAALPTSIDIVPSWESQARRRREADQRFNEVIVRIRAQSGFQNFLLPLTVEELMAAADPDPIVVINVSSYRCDAFVVEHHQIRALKLPHLNLKEVEKRIQSLRTTHLPSITPILEWLWDVVACPSLEALGFEKTPSDDNWPHVWWSLTGPLSLLPLHAAGLYAKGSTKTVLDRVMSSYTSSIKALIYGRRRSVLKSIQHLPKHALLIAMRETPNKHVLPFAGHELKMLNDLCPSLQLIPANPPQRREDVLARLRTCKIFHFAGHAQSNPLNPSRSCLLLEDWNDNPLTLGDLHDQRLQENSPFLAYLSACSTGANEADTLIDEGIHLVSACQVAGFRHVVGTLWGVSDMHCVDVAKAFYETLRDEGMTDVAVYRALHRAVRAVRDGNDIKASDGRSRAVDDEDDSIRLERKPILCDYETHNQETTQESPLYWAAYIHVGV